MSVPRRFVPWGFLALDGTAAGQPGMKHPYDLSFGKQTADELYDLRSDSHRLINPSGRAEFVATHRDLRVAVGRWMRDTADPRGDPGYDAWDRYPCFGGSPKAANARTVKWSRCWLEAD